MKGVTDSQKHSCTTSDAVKCTQTTSDSGKMGVVEETVTLQRTDFTKAWSVSGLNSFEEL